MWLNVALQKKKNRQPSTQEKEQSKSQTFATASIPGFQLEKNGPKTPTYSSHYTKKDTRFSNCATHTSPQVSAPKTQAHAVTSPYNKKSYPHP